MKLWPLLRPWLGLGALVFEMFQPVFGRPVEPLIVGAATAMMTLEVLSKAGKDE